MATLEDRDLIKKETEFKKGVIPNEQQVLGIYYLESNGKLLPTDFNNEETYIDIIPSIGHTMYIKGRGIFMVSRITHTPKRINDPRYIHIYLQEIMSFKDLKEYKAIPHEYITQYRLIDVNGDSVLGTVQYTENLYKPEIGSIIYKDNSAYEVSDYRFDDVTAIISYTLYLKKIINNTMPTSPLYVIHDDELILVDDTHYVVNMYRNGEKNV